MTSTSEDNIKGPSSKMQDLQLNSPLPLTPECIPDQNIENTLEGILLGIENCVNRPFPSQVGPGEQKTLLFLTILYIPSGSCVIEWIVKVIFRDGRIHHEQDTHHR